MKILMSEGPVRNYVPCLFSALDHEGLYRLAGVKSRVEDAKTRFDRGTIHSSQWFTQLGVYMCVLMHIW